MDSKDQSGAVAWSLGADRLNIYYNPYNIGSWALGIVSVSLPFEKYPDAVKEEYKMGPSDYSVKIGIYADYSADIYNDGSFSDVSVYPDEQMIMQTVPFAYRSRMKMDRLQAVSLMICIISPWRHIM